MEHKTIETDQIQLNLEAEDWEEAVRKAAQPLVKKNKVKPEYVDEIIRGARINGPYFVILKNVALPHANPKYGALQSAVSIGVLKKPVCFGHNNDPVKYIICLSSANTDEHLQNMSRLAELLGDETFYRILDGTQNKEMICDLINQS